MRTYGATWENSGGRRRAHRQRWSNVEHVHRRIANEAIEAFQWSRRSVAHRFELEAFVARTHTRLKAHLSQRLQWWRAERVSSPVLSKHDCFNRKLMEHGDFQTAYPGTTAQQPAPRIAYVDSRAFGNVARTSCLNPCPWWRLQEVALWHRPHSWSLHQ